MNLFVESIRHNGEGVARNEGHRVVLINPSICFHRQVTLKMMQYFKKND